MDRLIYLTLIGDADFLVRLVCSGDIRRKDYAEASIGIGVRFAEQHGFHTRHGFDLANAMNGVFIAMRGGINGVAGARSQN